MGTSEDDEDVDALDTLECWDPWGGMTATDMMCLGRNGCRRGQYVMRPRGYFRAARRSTLEAGLFRE